MYIGEMDSFVVHYRTNDLEYINANPDIKWDPVKWCVINNG
jgi:hypothetical protein